MTVAMRLAVKIAYDGTKFSGSQRQPEVRTVDGECLFVLKRIGALDGPKEAKFQSASRTDKDVSAVGNVIAFNTDLKKDALVGIFNSYARDVWAWAVASVPDGFNARHAVQRWYRYHLPYDIDVERARTAATLFKGRHDFKRFARVKTGTVKTIDSIDLSKIAPFVTLDVKGQSFLWSMVRRIVAAIILYSKGDAERAEIQAALAGEEIDFGLAPAAPLTLIDVRYDFDFKEIYTEKVRADLSEIILKSQLRTALWQPLAERLGVK